MLKRIEIATLGFPFLRTQSEWEDGRPPSSIETSQQGIAWADHLVFLYPLWLGTMPALMKAFLEQVFRPGFAMDSSEADKMPKKLLKGKSGRIVITMGMPASLYRWYFRAHSLKNLERNILRFCGISPIRESLIGSVEQCGDAKRAKWLAHMSELGQRGR